MLIKLKHLVVVALLLATVFPAVAHSQKLRVATLYIGSTMLPLWIARDEGYFARQGLDVELVWLQSTLSTLALIAAEVELIYGTPQDPSRHDRQKCLSFDYGRRFRNQIETLAGRFPAD